MISRNGQLLRISAVLVCLLLCTAPVAHAQSSRQTIETVLPRVVKIFGAGGVKNLESYGSGFLVSAEGHLVTVWSHVLDADRVTVVLDDGRRFDAELLGAEPSLELAVLKIDAQDLPFFDLDQISDAGPGTRVLAFSNVFEVAVGDEPVSVVHGVIAATDELSARSGRYDVSYTGPVYVVDAVTNNSGAAGGVLTTRDGQLLGMIGRQLQNSQSNTWLNYAMPLSELDTTIRQIQSGDFSRNRDSESTEFDDNFDSIDFGIVLVPDVVERTPAYVDAVLDGSQAMAEGLQPDDLIVFANNRLVHSCKAFEEELGQLQPSDDLTVVVRRGGVLLTISLTAPRTLPQR